MGIRDLPGHLGDYCILHVDHARQKKNLCATDNCDDVHQWTRKTRSRSRRILHDLRFHTKEIPKSTGDPILCPRSSNLSRNHSLL